MTQPYLMSPKPPHFPTRAKHVVFLFMNGAPSQVDTFDPKPALDKYHGSPYRGSTAVGSNGRPVGHLMKSPFPFARHGQSGLPISSLFPHTARFADDLCVIRSMYTDTAAHASGCLQMNTGNVVIGKPSLGSWLSYGLGTESESLPSFVVMTDPRGGPISGASNWGAGFMPAAYQGTLFRGKGSPLLDLATPEGTSARSQRHALDLIQDLNREHLATHPDETELAARIQSYELAFKMQTTAAEVVDLDTRGRSERERCTAWTASEREISAASVCWPAVCSSAACVSSSFTRAAATSRTPGTGIPTASRTTRLTPARPISPWPRCSPT